MNNILFEGYYGHQNSGDDAFIEVAAWGAKKYWYANNMTFIAENLPNIQTKVNFIGKQIYKGHNKLKLINSILQSKTFVSAGGSTFHSTLQRMEPKQLAFFKKKNIRNFKLGAIGVSLGPYKSKEAESENIEFLKHFDFLTLRDNFSYNLALSYKLPYNPIEAFDLAALLPEIYNNNNNNPIKNTYSKILGICICNYESYIKNGNIKNEERRNKTILELLKRISQIDTNVRFRFFVFNGNSTVGDEKLTNMMARELIRIGMLNVEIIPYNPNVFETWIKIKECSIVISSRLHAAIFACFGNVPFFLIEYHRKCSDFLDSVGYQKDLRLHDANFDIDDTANKIENILSKNTKFNEPSVYKMAITKALLNFTETSRYFVKET